MPSVPTSVIAGFLGVGKTTAVLHLSKQRPADQQWMVVVNEFGEVGIDGALLGDTLSVQELPGGCLCCVGDMPFRLMLRKVLDEFKPDKLIVEPTGLADLGRLLDTLQGFPDIDLGAVITLVDPRQVGDPRFEMNRLWRGQIEAADVLVANRCDVAGPASIRHFLEMAEAAFPPKLVATTAFGEIDPGWLDRPHETRPTQQVHLVDQAGVVPERMAKRLFRPVDGDGFKSMGWTFPSEDVFSAAKLELLVSGLMNEEQMIMRIKGVFRTDNGWRSLQADADGIRWKAASWRRDSRLSLITAPDVKPGPIESMLLAAKQ